MPRVEYYEAIKKQRFQVKLYALLCLLTLGAIFLYSFGKMQTYWTLKDLAVQNQQFVQVLKAEVADEKAVYEREREDFEAFTADIDKKLQNVFPVEENISSLIQQFDQFESNIARTDSPFEISSINFKGDTDEELYSYLPISMEIKSSPTNFSRYLQLIENSGSFDNEIRLMDIVSISIKLPQSQMDSQNNIVSFNVELNAYFQ